MKTLFLFFLWAFLVNGLGNSTQEKNMIRNGQFNGEPSFIHWYSEMGIVSKELGGNPGGYAWLHQEGNGQEEKEYTDQDPDLNQEISGFEVGKVYKISGDFKGGDKAPIHYNYPGDTVFAIDIDEVEIATFPLPKPVSKWTKFEAFFIAKDTTHILRFRGEINGTDGDVAIDNIVLNKEEKKNTK